ncbi:MAG TPA: hypothetical protein VKY79_00985 [Actinomycetaceae bacterium]|nr:hypothetical protein [Actinomycetaceae bacterium]
MDEDVTPQLLDRAARAGLRTLTKDNADRVAKHLVMAGRLIDVDPERAYEHAQAAARKAGRVAVVREAVALAAYATGRYPEALREVRTVRRLSGEDLHPAIEADCERGLGRPERALAVVAAAKRRDLPLAEVVELTLVESGARADLGEHEAGLLVVDKLLPSVRSGEPRSRLLEVLADRLEELGRHEEAAAARHEAGAVEPEPDPVVLDLLEGSEAPESEPTGSASELVAPARTPVAAPATDRAVESEPVADPSTERSSESEPVAAPSTAHADEPEPAADSSIEPAGEPQPDPAPQPAAAAPDVEQGELDLFTDTDPENRP